MNSTTRNVMALISASMLASACARQDEPDRTVSWFEQHPEERKAMLARCADDPGRLAATPNCVNASQAEGRESIGHWKDLPPLDLPLPKKEKDADEDSSRVRP